ncbi:MAG: flavodoxin family protein [Spirochaetales bacterium]|jgi:multimeric flavodoxin WrbA|nr:flavodoxin family protein [Spirochaetales bacterium]
MNVLAVNGSPRKGWNTHLLVQEALRGAASGGANTELVHLYDLNFRGCISCFECKRPGGPSLGRCAVRDELRPVLDKIDACDALIVGSPIYIHEISASARAFIERLTFQYITYRKDGSSFFKRRIQTALIYTMNIPESSLEDAGYSAMFKTYETLFTRLLGPVQSLICTATWQTPDYSKYEMSMFNGEERKKRREEVFPMDLKKAFEMGVALTRGKA